MWSVRPKLPHSATTSTRVDLTKFQPLQELSNDPKLTRYTKFLRYDFSVEYRDISERIALLTQEIRDLQEMNARYCTESEHTRRIKRAAHEARALRLLQIKEELSRMMPKPRGW